MDSIKITALANIGSNIAINTLVPVVNMNGTPVTQKANLQIVGNLFLQGAGGSNFAPAAQAVIAQTVANAAQPNITSVGTLNVNTLKISGGTNGYVLQTDGTGNVAWVAGGGSGNGEVGGSNSQIQFNLNGSFAGDTELTWDAGNNQLNTVNFAASHAIIYGNADVVNVNATGNLRPNAIYTDHYYYANGYVFGGGGGNGVPGGANTQVQFNDNGVFAGEGNFTYDSGNHILNVTRANVSYLTAYNSIVGGNSVTANYFIGSGANLTNIAGANVGGFVPNANVANTAFSVAVANVVGLGNIATIALNGNGSQFLRGNGTFGNAGGNTSALVNGDNSFVLDNDGNVVFRGLTPGDGVDRGLVWDFGANNGGVNSEVRQDGSGLTVRAFTATDYGNAPVNIVTNQNANTKTWRFDGTGNVTIPGNIIGIDPTDAIPFTSAITNITTGSTQVYVDLADNVFGGPYQGRVLISGVVGTTEANGTWYYEATDPNQFTLYTDDTYTTLVNGTTWTAYVSGGTAVGITSSSINLANGNITLTSASNNSWSFGDNGTLYFPDNSGQGWPINQQRYGMGNIGAWLDGQWTIGEFNGNISGATGIRIDPAIEGNTGMTFPSSADSVTQPVQVYSTGGSGISLYTGSNNWQFNSNGNVVFPTLTVDLHNGGNQSAQTLQFGNQGLQAVITGPTPAVDTAAQRLIIQGQRGSGLGEGGDVYVWAGDSDVNGGDIKIYAGDADVSGYGGYINIDAGSGVDGGGQLTLTGGYSSGGQGGQVTITPGYSGDAAGAQLSLNGGQGAGDGGPVNIQAGYGGANGGQVTITGGGSALGLPHYGNVVVQAGASGWTFDNGGKLTVPSEGIIQSINDTVILRSVDSNSNIYSARLGTNGGLYFETTAYPTGWLSLTNNSGNANITAATGTAGGAGKHIIINAGDADQSDYYTSAGGNINIRGGLGAFNDGGGGGPGGSINIFAGNSSDPAGVSGNINITSSSHVWTFDNGGSLTFPDSSIQTTAYPGTSTSLTLSGNLSAGGNLDVDGNTTIGGNLFVTGNINFTGNVTQISGNSGVFYGNASTGAGALYAGKTGYTPLPNTVVQMTGDDNAYVQINLQNTNHGNKASMELAITADDGDDANNYIDMGIASSTWDGTQDNSLGTAVGARDGYLYVQGGATGGNLVLGTTTSGYKIKFNAGGPNSANTVATIDAGGFSATGNVIAGHLKGEGGNISNIQGANVSGAVTYATTANAVAGANVSGAVAYATTANSVAGANVTGAVSYATTANSVAAANVSGLGNVALLSKDGNASNVLYGNGAFAALTAGTSLVNGTSNVVVNTNANVIIGTNGNAGVMDIGADGRVRMLTGPKQIGGNIANSEGYIQFSTGGLTYFAGNVQLLGGGYIKGPAGTNVIQLNSPENSSARIVGNLAVGASNTGAIYAGTIAVSGNANVGNLGTTGLITATGNVSGGNLTTGGVVSATGNISTSGTFVGNGAGLTNVTVNAAGNIQGTSSNVTLVAGSYSYLFDNTGNFTMPTNSDIVFSGNTTLTSTAGSNGNVTVNPDGTGQFVLTSITPATFGNALTVSGNVTVNGTGSVITPNRPAFRVYGNGVTSVSTTTNTNGVLNGNNWLADYNQGGYLNSTTGTFTAPVAGLYQINLQMRVANNTAPSAQAIVVKNRGSSPSNQVMWESAANCTVNHFGVSTVSKLAAGDTLNLVVAVGALTFDVNDNWSVAFLG